MEERGGGDLGLAGVEAVGEVAGNLMQVQAHVTAVGLGEGLVWSVECTLRSNKRIPRSSYNYVTGASSRDSRWFGWDMSPAVCSVKSAV